MTNTNQERLDFLLRRNRGRFLMPVYLEQTSLRLQREVTTADLISLSHTERLQEAVTRRVNSLLEGRISAELDFAAVDTDQCELAEGFVSSAARLLRGESELFLLATGSEACGATRVTAEEVEQVGIGLVGDDEDPVRVTSSRAQAGLRIYADTVAGHQPRRWSLLRWRPLG
jgi:hypothetical protein